MAVKVVMAKAAHLPDRAVMAVNKEVSPVEATAIPLSKVGHNYHPLSPPRDQAS